MTESLYDVTTMWELVARRSAQTPDAPMLLDDADRRVTFGEAAAWAERVAAGLQELGVGPGTAVTWQLTTRIETVVVSLALCRLGAVQNPIIPIYREREVGFALRQTGAALFLVPGTWRGFDYAAMGEKLAAGMDAPPRVLVAYDELPSGDPATLPPPPADDGVRWIYFTSGTTADPKGVRHTDGTLLAGGRGLAVALDMSPADVGSMAFPFAHIGGPDYLVTLLASGFPVALMEAFVPAEAVASARHHGVTMAGGSTAFYTAFLNEQRKQPGEKVIPTLRLLSGGGAPKPPEVFYEVQREIGVPVAHGYGMTEVPMITQGSPSDTDEQLANSEGAPVLGAEVKVVREDGSAADAGEDGEVRVRGPMVCKGYTDPSLNAAAFDDDGFFRTGDLGHLREDGHLTLTGRLKDVIIRKGENISAKEVEDLVYQHPKVADVAVIGLPDPQRGERVCAVIEVAPDREAPSVAELGEFLAAAGLMMQKIPEQVEVVDKLPRNATMKVLKYQLRDELRGKPWP
ncbi:MAG TPA: AMP-binding protein [Acidimicrobiales bacterium]|jgi:acyl-CoA synthetase (AMP-forming)/AMP-acid ligase II